ncbi:hypothetical protein I4F81_007860 [Pyropia yezoensis]|uniref:Uncharacterized protein n=1 Tax=Pyropia yezoensis TaxID=2788 RepID=A0ACC3C583_PYRYE|nr:hypothetical protein I4F81_007860 [Neopyropia yezoensis]
MLRVTRPHASPPSHASMDALTVVSRHERNEGHDDARASNSSRGTDLSFKSCTYARRLTWYCSVSLEAISTCRSSASRHKTKTRRPSSLTMLSRRGRAGVDPSARRNSRHIFSMPTDKLKARSIAAALEKITVHRGRADRRPAARGVYVADRIETSSSSPFLGNKKSRTMAASSWRALPVKLRLPDGARAGHAFRRFSRRLASTFFNERPSKNSCCRATARSTSRPNIA